MGEVNFLGYIYLILENLRMSVSSMSDMDLCLSEFSLHPEICPLHGPDIFNEKLFSEVGIRKWLVLDIYHALPVTVVLCVLHHVHLFMFFEQFKNLKNLLLCVLFIQSTGQTCSKDHLYIKRPPAYPAYKDHILQVPRCILSMLLNLHIKTTCV